MDEQIRNQTRSPGIGARFADSRLAQLAAVVAAIVLASVLVTSTTRAAFSSTTTNVGNSVSTGSVVLTDSDSATAMFDNITGIAPGTNVDRCIRVDYTGSIDPVAVKLYMGAAPTGTLGQYLNLQVDVGASNADSFSACTSFSSTSMLYSGTIDGFRTAYQAWASGLATTWDPAGTGEARMFRFRIAVQNTDTAQGLSSGFGFTWETQST